MAALEHSAADVSSGHIAGAPKNNRKRLKERALAFYRQHGVTDALERLLNEMYLAEPKDIYGYMVNEGYRG